jgi:hypothetical protein
MDTESDIIELVESGALDWEAVARIGLRAMPDYLLIDIVRVYGLKEEQS